MWVYHITWFVNSAAHAWGYQDYETGAAWGCLRWDAWLGAGTRQHVGNRLNVGLRAGLQFLQQSSSRRCPRLTSPIPPRLPAGDQSRNNWWVGLLGFGEGWHNNHHAFEFSARHGLEVRTRGAWHVFWSCFLLALLMTAACC